MPEETEVDAIVKLRDEMQEQFNTLRDSYEAQRKEQSELIEKLKEQNEGLQRALVRSATLPPEKKEVEKTEEELYKEHIDALAQKTYEYMRMIE